MSAPSPLLASPFPAIYATMSAVSACRETTLHARAEKFVRLIRHETVARACARTFDSTRRGTQAKTGLFFRSQEWRAAC